MTLSKDSGSGGDYALEAGALVLADQGCCFIDEFDKMGNQHQALLEAMVKYLTITCQVCNTVEQVLFAGSHGKIFNNKYLPSMQYCRTGFIRPCFNFAQLIVGKFKTRAN